MRPPDRGAVAGWTAISESLDGARWQRELREGARRQLATTGFPPPGDERWKYTNPRGLSAEPLPIATPGDVDLRDAWFVEADLDRLVFVDGRFEPRWSKVPPDAAPLSQSGPVTLGDVVRPDDGGFEALNLATFSDGAVIRIQGSRAAPIALVHVSTGQGRVLASLRHRIELAAGANATILWDFQGAGTGLSSTASELVVGDGASVRCAELQDESIGAHHLHHLGIHAGVDGSVEARWVAVGAAVARTEVDTRLARGAMIDLAGLVLARGTQHVDFHTATTHAGAHATSRQLFKEILDDRAHGVYTGRVVVPPGAVGSDATQSNPALLLSDSAVAVSRPQLEIRCDEVKAAHGASIGRLDSEAQFYLQARGLGSVEARALLTGAFASAVVEALAEPLRSTARHRVSAWLEWGAS